MKIKGNMFWLMLNLLIVLGIIGLSIYQIYNSKFDWINILVLVVLVCNFYQFIGIKK